MDRSWNSSIPPGVHNDDGNDALSGARPPSLHIHPRSRTDPSDRNYSLSSQAEIAELQEQIDVMRETMRAAGLEVEPTITLRNDPLRYGSEKWKQEGSSGPSKKESFDVRKTGQSEKVDFCDTCKSAHRGPCGKDTMRCKHCGELGHKRQYCKGRKIERFNRRKNDHISSLCAKPNEHDEVATIGEKRKPEEPSSHSKSRDCGASGVYQKKKSVFCNACSSCHIGQCGKDTMKCRRCGKMGHVLRDCKSREPMCYNCKEMGHLSAQCPEPRAEKYESGARGKRKI